MDGSKNWRIFLRYCFNKMKYKFIVVLCFSLIQNILFNYLEELHNRNSYYLSFLYIDVHILVNQVIGEKKRSITIIG
jgi:hypothetical protein